MIEMFRPRRDIMTDGAMSSLYYFRARRTSSSDNFFQPAPGVTLQDEHTNELNEATRRTREIRLGPATARASKRAWRARAPEYVHRTQTGIMGILRHRWPSKRLPRSPRRLKLLAENPILRRSMETILHHLNMPPTRGISSPRRPLRPHIQRWGLPGGAGLFPFRSTR